MAEDIILKYKLDMSDLDAKFEKLKAETNDLKRQVERNVKVNIDTTEAQKELKELEGAAKKTSSTFGDMFKGFLASSLVVGGIQGIISTLGNLNSKVVAVTAEFQKFEAVLTNTLGSKNEAVKVMKQITEFAAKTPFQVNELTDSFVKFANRGIKLTVAEMTKLGDIASSQGKSFNQLTEAVLDAQTGEFERLKEFGIKASKNGDQVSLSFKNITKTVENNEQAIKNAILSYGDLAGVTGGMEAISRTLGGQLSNLEDNVTSLFKAIGDRTSEYTADAVAGYSNLISTIKEFIEIPQSQKVAEEKFELNALVSTIKDVNTSNETRSVLIQQLNNQYPDFVKQVDISKDSDEKLQRVLKATNDQYDRRVFALSVSEATDKYNKKISESIQLEGRLELQREKAKTGQRDELLFTATASLENEINAERVKRKALEAERTKTIEALSKVAKNAGINTTQAIADELKTAETTGAKIGKAKSEAQIKAEQDARKKAQKESEKFDKAFEDQAQKLEDIGTQETLKRWAEEAATLEKDKKRAAQLNEENAKQVKTQQEDAIKKDKELNDIVLDGLNEIDTAREVSAKVQAEQQKQAEDKLKAQIDLISGFAKNGILLELGINPASIDRIKQSVESAVEIFNKPLSAFKDASDQQNARIAAGATVLSNTYTTISDAIRESDRRETQRKLDELNAQQEEELRLAGENEQKKEVIKQKYDLKRRELRRKEAQADKDKAIFDAVIATAVGIAQSLTTPFLIPIIAALGAAQVALIASRPLPKFAKGGRVKDGLIQGRPHSAGGVVLEAEGDEFIVNKNSTAKHLGLIDAINSDKAEDYLNRHIVMPAIQKKESEMEQRVASIQLNHENNIINKAMAKTLNEIKRGNDANTDKIVMAVSNKNYGL